MQLYQYYMQHYGNKIICKLKEGPSNLHFKLRPGCFKTQKKLRYICFLIQESRRMFHNQAPLVKLQMCERDSISMLL